MTYNFVHPGTAPETNQPVGVIVAYIGDVPPGPAGGITDDVGSTWLLCDGSEITSQQFPDLYNALVATYGNVTASIPDLRGYFVRFLDAQGNNTSTGTGRDPDLAARTPFFGNLIGSLERNACPHDHDMNGFQSCAWSVYGTYWTIIMAADSNNPPNQNNIGNQTETGSGTATTRETRPINVAVNYIIRATSGTATPQQTSPLPVGSVLHLTAYGAPDTNSEMWLPCDGSPPAQETSAALFSVVGYRYGSQTTGPFSLPDLRGYFARGQDPKGTHDPDVSSRTPLNAQYASTDVGSVQEPAVYQHTHGIQNFRSSYGSGERDERFPPPPPPPTFWNCYAPSAGTSDIENTTYLTMNFSPTGPTPTGGNYDPAQDIRPGNIALPSAILVDRAALSEVALQQAPVGTILLYAGDAEPATFGYPNWVLCQGAPVAHASAAYARLFAVLFPDEPPSPIAPDLRGLFLRGLDPSGTVDIDTPSSRVPLIEGAVGGLHPLTLQPFATASHLHGIAPQSEIDQGGTEILSGDGGGDQESGMTVVETGGKETRPRNIYLNYIIRVA